MTVPSCVRCGQLLLPEIVRELGEGRRCPFCGADLKPDAKVDIKKTSPARSPPLAPLPRSTRSAAAPTLPGMAGARVQTAAAVAVAVAPSTPRSSPAPVAAALAPSTPRSPHPAAVAVAVAPSTARSSMAAVAAVVAPSRPRPNTAPTMAFVPAPQPDTAPNLLSAPVPRPNEAEAVLAQQLNLAPLPSDAAPPWLAARPRRRWLAAPAVLAVIVTIGLVVGRRPTAVTRGSSVPAASAVPPPAALPTASPLPPAAAAADQEARKDSGLARSHTAADRADERAGTHAVHRTNHQEKRTAHPSRSKRKRVVALERPPAPKRAEDERSARASYERGNQRLLTGDTAAAISAYEEAVRSAPSSPSGYRGLGLAYEKEGKIAEAVRAFRKYLELAPSSGDRDLVARRVRHLLRSGGHPGK